MSTSINIKYQLLMGLYTFSKFPQNHIPEQSVLISVKQHKWDSLLSCIMHCECKLVGSFPSHNIINKRLGAYFNLA